MRERQRRGEYAALPLVLRSKRARGAMRRYLACPIAAKQQ
jgi:hypothetical protein